MYNRTLWRVGCAKARSITYSECMSVTSVTQHAMRMFHIVISGPALQYFPRYLINGTVFEKKKVIEYKMLVLIFSTTLKYFSF